MMSNAPEDPRMRSLRETGQKSQGDNWEPLVQSAGRACQRGGVTEEQFVNAAISQPNGAALVTSIGIDNALNESSAAYDRNGDKEAGRQGDRIWEDYWLRNHPDSRKAKWIREKRGIG
jgi:hypothetical protein